MLGAFIAATQKDDDFVATLLEVNAISGTEVDAKLTDAVSYRFDITRQAIGQAKNSLSDQRLGAMIA